MQFLPIFWQQGQVYLIHLCGKRVFWSKNLKCGTKRTGNVQKFQETYNQLVKQLVSSNLGLPIYGYIAYMFYKIDLKNSRRSLRDIRKILERKNRTAEVTIFLSENFLTEAEKVNNLRTPQKQHCSSFWRESFGKVQVNIINKCRKLFVSQHQSTENLVK